MLEKRWNTKNLKLIYLSNVLNFGHWNFGVVWNLVLGIWNLR